MKHRRYISIEEQKKIAIEMWQYIKAQIEQHEPMDSITFAKKEWLKNNYPDIRWNNHCLLCTIYLHPEIYDDGSYGFTCPNCPLSKKYREQAPYGCALIGAVTPWSKIVDYDYKHEEALEACDEIIAAIKSI